jgi:hypothetical protein
MDIITRKKLCPMFNVHILTPQLQNPKERGLVSLFFSLT